MASADRAEGLRRAMFPGKGAPQEAPLSIQGGANKKMHRQSFCRCRDSCAAIGVLFSATTPFNAFAELVPSVTVMFTALMASKFAALTTLAGVKLRTFPEFAVLMHPVFTPVFNDIIRRGYRDGGSLKS